MTKSVNLEMYQQVLISCEEAIWQFDGQTKKQNADVAVLEIIHLQLILSRFKLNRCLINADCAAFVLFLNVAIKIGAWTCEPS